jgi:hypothetical protein
MAERGRQAMRWLWHENRETLFKLNDNTVIEIFAAGRGQPPISPFPNNSLQIMLEVEDIDSAYRELKFKGVDLKGNPIQKPWLRQLIVRDPSSVEVWLFTYPD